MKEAAEALEGPCGEVRKDVLRASVVHAQEGHRRVEKKLVWLSDAMTDGVTCYLICRCRSQAVAKELLGPETSTIVQTDPYSACGWLPLHRRQLCLAHAKRQAKAMRERAGKSVRIGALLLNSLEFVFLQHARMCRGEITRATMRDSMLKHARSRMRALPGEAARLKRAKTAVTCRFLLQHEPSLWVFLSHDGVEPTKSAAEPALGSPVIWRKIRFGNNTESGARCTGRLLGIAETCRQAGRRIRTVLTDALVACRQGRQPLGPFPEPAT